MALAKLISFTIIPVFIIGPVAGAWVDRLDRRRVMILSDIFRGVLVLTIPFFIAMKQMLPIYFVIFLAFSLSRFFIPSKMALIPDLVSQEKLLLANSLQDTTHMIGNVVGFVVAGAIVSVPFIGAIGGFYIDSATFFISACLIAMITSRIAARDARGGLHNLTVAASLVSGFRHSLRRSIAREIYEGVRDLAASADSRFIIYVFSLLLAGVGAVSCVIIVFIQTAFGTSTRDLGLIGMFLAAGLFFGTILYGRFCQRVKRRSGIHISFALSGISVVLFAGVVQNYPNIIAAGALAGMLGICASPIMVSTTTIVHETIPEAARGRVFSSLEAVMHLAFLVFMFITAFAARYIGRFWILAAVGMVFLVCGVAGLVRMRRR